MIDPIELGYRLGIWKSQLNVIAAKVEDFSTPLCLQIERITDQIEDFIRNNKNDD